MATEDPGMSLCSTPNSLTLALGTHLFLLEDHDT